MDSLFSINKAVSQEETPFTLEYNLDIEGKLAIINSFKHTKLTKDETKIMVLFEEITKSWFDQLHI